MSRLCEMNILVRELVRHQSPGYVQICICEYSLAISVNGLHSMINRPSTIYPDSVMYVSFVI